MVQHLRDRRQTIPLVVLQPATETPTVRLPPPPPDLPSSSLHSNNYLLTPLVLHSSSSSNHHHHRLRRIQEWEEHWSYRINKAIRTPKHSPHSSSSNSNSYKCTPRSSSSSRWCQHPLPRPPIPFRYSKVHRRLHQLRFRLLLPQTRLLFRLKPQRNSNPMAICGAI